MILLSGIELKILPYALFCTSKTNQLGAIWLNISPKDLSVAFKIFRIILGSYMNVKKILYVIIVHNGLQYDVKYKLIA